LGFADPFSNPQIAEVFTNPFSNPQIAEVFTNKDLGSMAVNLKFLFAKKKS